MLRKIIDDTISKIDGNLSNERKMFLLSGHEINCAYMLRLLGVFKPHIPPYGAQVIFELHKINGVYGYKVTVATFPYFQKTVIIYYSCRYFIKITLKNCQNYWIFLVVARFVL